MSWIDDIETIIFTIITGDKKSYTPKWRNASKNVEYNVSIFEFIEVEGSLAIKKKPKGRRFDLEFYFDGENAVIDGNNFELSARNSNDWEIKHPYYGNFKCQPLSLSQDNSILNVSRFTVPVIETITNKYPTYTPIISDRIEEQLSITNENQAQAFNDSKELVKNELISNVEAMEMRFSSIIENDDELLEFKKLVSDAIIEINSTISDGNSILTSIQALINYPSTIIQTIEARFNAFKESFETLISSFTGNKNQFEALGGSIIASMMFSSVNNINDSYETRNRVLEHQYDLISVYNRYIDFLDSLQTDRADSIYSYIPSYIGLNNLNSLVNLAISNLYSIAFDAKQEREYILERDDNIINLTHRFYGLDKNDVNLERFIAINDIGLNELLTIKQGRKIIYYV